MGHWSLGIIGSVGAEEGVDESEEFASNGNEGGFFLTAVACKESVEIVFEVGVVLNGGHGGDKESTSEASIPFFTDMGGCMRVAGLMFDDVEAGVTDELSGGGCQGKAIGLGQNGEHGQDSDALDGRDGMDAIAEFGIFLQEFVEIFLNEGFLFFQKIAMEFQAP